MRLFKVNALKEITRIRLKNRTLKKSTEVWTYDNGKKYTTLFNYMVNKYGEEKVNEDTFINDYKRTLMKEVEDNPKWGSKLSQRNLLFYDKKVFSKKG